MKYRREIDGLRALAIVPVIFFHAGFRGFRGGFVGVDVFFVISGYLISTILINDLQTDKFSIVRFYERRARRILPALFTVMAFSSVIACAWMLPDELKNFGQSLIATTLFSNNILLDITSGYWAMASEFKPLLHTWSLGVEEQYYVFYPLLLALCWTYFRKRVTLLLGVLTCLSFVAAEWFAVRFPDATFYLLPTRAWEIFAGALAAIYIAHRKESVSDNWRTQAASLVGLVLIVLSVCLIHSNTAIAQRFIFIPVLGSVLIVLFATESNVAGRILGTRVLVGIGLISYSLYLWHQPLFAFARIYSKEPPGPGVYAVLSLVALALSCISWRYIEGPFRDKKRVSRRSVVIFSVAGSAAFIAFGAYLNHSYGMLSRIYDPRAVSIGEMDKRIYNQRVFRFQKAQFSDPHKLHLLVIGDSFGRDFVNMTLETFDTSNVEIVYRHDFRGCIFPYKSALERTLYSEADVVVFASWDPELSCIHSDSEYFENNHKAYYYVGTKQFGYNLNWIRRLQPSNRANQYNRLLPATVDLENKMAAAVPAGHFISLLDDTVKNGSIPITDEHGYLISTDRRHVTKFGAIYFGREVLKHSAYGKMLEAANAAHGRAER